VNIAIIGYGKMGHEVERIALLRGHKVISHIDIDNPQDFESESFKKAQVAIEFTAPTQAFDNITRAFKAGVKVVSGSTGWFDSRRNDIEQLCFNGRNTLFWSSNFSIGVALFTKVSNTLAHMMNSFPEYEVNISETHHVHKLDAPSGTAISLAQGIIKELDRKLNWDKGLLYAPDGTISGNSCCAPEQIRIDSKRIDEIPGIHTITYDSPSDQIILTHSAKNRSGLALGAVLAAEYTASHTGLLTMDDLMNSLYSNNTL